MPWRTRARYDMTQPNGAARRCAAARGLYTISGIDFLRRTTKKQCIEKNIAIVQWNL